VPAFKACSAPNRTHGTPLAFPSCTPPVQASNYLTIGSPDANGAGANSVGSLTWNVNGSTSKITVTASITDVRCLPGTAAGVCSSPNAADGPDYSGQVQAINTIRITDHKNGSGLNEAATVVDIPNPVTMYCVNTASTAAGGVCTYTASVGCPPACPDPGWRQVAEFGQFEVLDGGPDGQISTADNTVFMRQGIFIP